MWTRRRSLAVAAGCLTALLLFSVTLLPLIVRNKAISALEENTGRKVRIGSVSINPFTLTVTVADVSVDQPGGPPLLAFRRLRASLALASLYKRALILSPVTLDTPSVSFTRTGPNRYSFSDIIDRQRQSPKPEKKAPFLFSVNNITINDGSLDFDDRLVAGGRRHTIRSLQVALPFISNIPYLSEKYTDPSVTAVLNGAPFRFAGKLKPLSKSLETSVRIDLKQLSLPQYVAYSPVKLPVDLASGSLTVDTDVSYRISADKKPELTVKGMIMLDRIGLNLPDTGPLLKLPALKLKAARLDLFTRVFELDALDLDGLELFVSRNARGAWNFSRLLPPAAPEPHKPAPAANAAPGDTQQPRLAISSLTCRNAAVHFADTFPRGGFRTLVSDIDLTASAISTAANSIARYDLSFLVDRDTEFDADGTFSLTPLAATASLELSGLKLQRGWPYLSRFLTAPVKGSLDLSGQLAFTAAEGVTVEKGRLSLTGLSARFGAKDGFDAALLEVTGAAFRQRDNRLEIDTVRLSGGEAAVSREKDGSMSPLALLVPATATPPSASRAGAAAGAAPAKPLSYRLSRVLLERFNLAFTDKSREDDPRFTLRNTSLSLSNLQGPAFTPAALRFSAIFGKDAPLKASGDLTPRPFRYKGSVSVGRLPIRDFEAYFPDTLNVFVIGGYLDAAMQLDLGLKNGKPSGSFRGSAGIRSFHGIDTLAEEDLLKWESLQFDDLRGELDPFSLQIHQVALNNAYARVVVRKDGTLNLQNLVEKPAPPAAAAAAPSAPVAPAATQPLAAAPAPGGAAPRRIAVEMVTIQDSTLSFTDNHLPQTFSSTFFGLGGRVSGLSSEENRYADLDLRGNLENHSPLQITGKLNPLRNDLFVDLKISFRDIDLSPATPYSGTYLGYTVDKGKLFLDLKYLIDKKELNSENKVFIDQFTFGRKVDSDKATNLPVRLAVALLKDRKGEIHLDLPVTGRTDDPRFSIWGVIGQILKNLLVKAATSPFALLSSLMGQGEDFSSVGFAAGSSRLAAEEQQKLKQLAKALAERPGLKVEIKGFVDAERDPEGYRQEQLDHKLRREKFLELAKEKQTREGDTAESVAVEPAEYPRLLKAVYKKEKFPKPRNVLGLVKDLPDAEMKKLIIANTVVGENELQALARERSAAVMDYLVSQGLPAERLFQKNEDIRKAPGREGARRNRVEFNAIAP